MFLFRTFAMCIECGSFTANTIPASSPALHCLSSPAILVPQQSRVDNWHWFNGSEQQVFNFSNGAQIMSVVGVPTSIGQSVHGPMEVVLNADVESTRGVIAAKDGFVDLKSTCKQIYYTEYIAYSTVATLTLTRSGDLTRPCNIIITVVSST